MAARAFACALLRKQPVSLATNTPESGRPWLRIIVPCLLILVILLAVAGFFYENICEARDRRFHPMPGQLVDVGGYKMHIDCTGTFFSWERSRSRGPLWRRYSASRIS